MFEVVKKIFSLLTKEERRQLYWLTSAIVVLALIEVAGIASLMPFMAVVGKPEVVENNRYLYWVYHSLGFDSVNSFLVFLGVLVFIIMLLSNAFKAMVLWLELDFVHYRVCSLARRLFFGYLSQPYEFFLNQNTAILGKNILHEVTQFTANVLSPCTQIFSGLVVILFIFSLLLFVDPVLAVMIVSILGGAYILLYFLVQRKLARLGEERFEANSQRFKVAGEAFGGVKELKVLRRERYFFDQFCRFNRKMEGSWVSSNLIGQLPRFVMEVLSFGGILVIVLYFLMIRQDLGQTLPVMALYVFAGYRLMPALQSTFSAVTKVRFNLATLDALQRDLSGISENTEAWQEEKGPVLPFKDKIQLASVSFTYHGAETPVIQGLNLTIEKKSSIGLVGSTGSGKTTIVDIILGLLTPQQGCLMVDGTPVPAEKLLQWQQNLGYVPQTIFLCDDSLASNIAFGVPPEVIDMEAVERAARIANLHEFVTNELPDGYETKVGERGVRLSGGQRQRIGIARALFHNPEVLIMDEATSALDGITEEAVIQAIRNLAGEKTVITIAHRLSTLKDCDLIYVMDNGRVVEQGTYSELMIRSGKFQAMSRAMD